MARAGRFHPIDVNSRVAITSNMSKLALLFGALALGCGPRPLPAGYGAADARAFVREHRAEIEEEIHVGSGDALYQLAVIAGCQNLPQLNRTLRQHRAELFEPPAPSDEVAARVVDLLAQRPELRCLDLELSRQRMFSAGRRHIGPPRHRAR